MVRMELPTATRRAACRGGVRADGSGSRGRSWSRRRPSRPRRGCRRSRGCPWRWTRACACPRTAWPWARTWPRRPAESIVLPVRLPFGGAWLAIGPHLAPSPAPPWPVRAAPSNKLSVSARPLLVSWARVKISNANANDWQCSSIDLSPLAGDTALTGAGAGAVAGGHVMSIRLSGRGCWRWWPRRW